MPIGCNPNDRLDRETDTVEEIAEFLPVSCRSMTTATANGFLPLLRLRYAFVRARLVSL